MEISNTDMESLQREQLLELMGRMQVELATLKKQETEWRELKQSAVEIIQYDATMEKQSPYWRSMMLSLVQALSVDRQIIEQHIDFVVSQEEGVLTNVSMRPKTEQGMKLIQIWGVVDMMGELIKTLSLKKEE